MPHRWKLMVVATGLLVLSALAAAPSARAQDTIRTDFPPRLVRLARVPEATARARALARVPHGTVRSAELERENGHLQYSYDIAVPHQQGITEVNVDAVSGKVLSVGHEGPREEAKEAKEDSTGRP